MMRVYRPLRAGKELTTVSEPMRDDSFGVIISLSQQCLHISRDVAKAWGGAPAGRVTAEPTLAAVARSVSASRTPSAE